ncbi:MAG: hypothetical protein WDO06_05610 [Actinomycetota bacterium]
MSFIANWTFKHRKLVVLLWLLLLGGITVLAQNAGTAYSDSFTLPNTESKTALDLLTKYAPTQRGTQSSVVRGKSWRANVRKNCSNRGETLDSSSCG